MERRSDSYLLAGIASCLLWGGSAIGTKLSYDSLMPMQQGLLRFALATLVFAAVLAFRGELRLPQRRDLPWIALTGILGISLYFAAENVGVSLCSAATASLVVGSFPAMALVVECLVDRTRPKPLMALGIVLAFCGIALLGVTEGGDGGDDQPLGIVILMLGGLCWALYNIAMRPLLGHQSVFVTTAWQSLFGTLGFIPLAVVEGAPLVLPSPTAVLSLAYLVLGCTVAAFTLYNHALKGLSASAASALLNLIPVFGLVLSATVLGEAISATQIAGGAVVIAGIALSSR